MFPRLAIAALVLTGVISLAITVGSLDQWAIDLAEAADQRSSNIPMLLSATAVYALMLAIPYVPGVELGLLMMVSFGKPGILMAWTGTIIGLNLAYGVGVFLRSHALHWTPVSRLRATAGNFDALRESQTGRFRLLRMFGQHRLRNYILVGVLFNVPGNAIVGGGGAISLVAGLSGRLQWPRFLLTSMIATSVIPLLAWFGVLQISRIINV